VRRELVSIEGGLLRSTDIGGEIQETRSVFPLQLYRFCVDLAFFPNSRPVRDKLHSLKRSDGISESSIRWMKWDPEWMVRGYYCMNILSL